MADGAITLTLDDYTFAKIAERARAVGVAPETLAAMVLDARFFDYDDFAWTDGDPRDRGDDAGVREDVRPWSAVRSEFLALIDKAFGAPE